MLNLQRASIELWCTRKVAKHKRSVWAAHIYIAYKGEIPSVNTQSIVPVACCNFFFFFGFSFESPVSLVEENIISYLLTRLKIHRHIYIIANMPPINILTLSVCRMFVTWT